MQKCTELNANYLIHIRRHFYSSNNVSCHYFNNADDHGNTWEFNLSDGFFAAMSPTIIALHELTKAEMAKKRRPVPLNCQNVLVISLGCGTAKKAPVYTADIVNKYSMTDWVVQLRSGRSPMLEMLNEGSADMVDYHASVLFESQGVENNYLRIQDDQLDESISLGDDASIETMTKLKEVGDNLLNKPVSRMHLLSGDLVPVEGLGSNADALKRFAKILSEEKKLRSKKV